LKLGRKFSTIEYSVNYLVKKAESGNPVAFVFDIDGVLLRGNSVIPAAKRTLQTMYDCNKQYPRLPLVFLTNGGGVTEESKAMQLSKRLGVRITADQIVLSHTPFQSLTQKLSSNPVLVIGRGDVELVAKSYGLNKTITTRQLVAAHPTAVPFCKDLLNDDEDSQKIRQTTKSSETQYGSSVMPIQAVLVFSDPSDWYVDIQIVVDIVAGGGG
jgi:HAD superfamily hydrolase (TIGR01456 family)